MHRSLRLAPVLSAPILSVLILSVLAIGLSGCERSAITGSSAPLAKSSADIPIEEGVTSAKAVFAGGCFWCTEAAFEQIAGVVSVVSGYAGGSADDATYEAVRAGDTDHAESIEVTYDPSVRTYGELLQVFFTAHDPTQLNYQGPDHGRQYRSTIFFASDAEKSVAEEYIKELNASGAFTAPIATTLEPLREFYPAEEYHQDFVKRNPNHPYVRAWSVPKATKVREHYPEWLR